MADIRTKARGKGIRLTRDSQGKRVKKTNEALRKEINLRNLAAMKNRVTQAAATMRTCRQLVKNRCTCATKKSSPMMRRVPPPPPPPMRRPITARAVTRGPAMPPNLIAQLKKNLNRRGLRQIANRNARTSVA
jgi:hypothetical protein